MITETILDFIFSWIFSLFSDFPLMDFTFDISKYSYFFDDIEFAVWFLPWGAIVAIISINGVLMLWRIFWNVIKVILEFIPFL